MDALKCAAYVKKIHEKTKEAIEKKAKYYVEWAKKHRKEVTFQPGYFIWVHLRKEHFPKKRKSKLMPRGDGPFRVLAKINDNAYKIELPEDYGVSTTFNFADLTPYVGPEESESRMTPFQEGEDDEDIPDADISTNELATQKGATQSNVNQGPVTRSRTNKLQLEVNSLLAEFKLHTNENCLLPKCCTLVVLRFTHEDTGYTQQEEGHINPTTSYMKTNKVAAQAKIGYSHKTLGYTTDASTFHANLYQSAWTRGA
jgi:hypothetical protein